VCGAHSVGVEQSGVRSGRRGRRRCCAHDLQHGVGIDAETEIGLRVQYFKLWRDSLRNGPAQAELGRDTLLFENAATRAKLEISYCAIPAASSISHAC